MACVERHPVLVYNTAEGEQELKREYFSEQREAIKGGRRGGQQMFRHHFIYFFQ